jgi:hypothetical protein
MAQMVKMAKVARVARVAMAVMTGVTAMRLGLSDSEWAAAILREVHLN